MSARDVTVKMPGGNFNYRVGAIIVDGGEILMARNGAGQFFTVGGRVRFGESARDALLREAFEETQIRLEIDRLAYVHENFFELDGGEFYHEIAFFFRMRPNSLLREMPRLSFTEEEYGDIALQWLPVGELGSLRLYPEFFKTELLKPDAGDVRHFVTRNDATILVSV